MSDRRIGLVLVPGIAAGLLTRFWNLPGQILSGDELHAPQAALSQSLGEILTTYHAADNCLPLTAFFKLWLLAGGRLSEAVLRAPTLAASLIMIVALPWLVAQALRKGGDVDGSSSTGRRSAGWLAVLLAISPPLVLYGRIARPYAAATLMAWIALLALVVWREEARPARVRWPIVAGIAAGLAIWLHPLTAPFLAAAYAFVAVDVVVTSRNPRTAPGKQLALLALPAAIALGIVMGPAMPSLVGLAGQKIEAGAETEAASLEAWLFFAGTPTAARAVPFAVLAALGLVCLWRRSRRLAAITSLTLVGQFVGILLVHPVGISVPLIFGRYLLFALPGPLIWIACLLDSLARPQGGAAGTWIAPRPIAAVGLVALLVACGPLHSASYRKSSFVHHNDWLQIVGFVPRVAAEEVPVLYRELPEAAVLLEMPASTMWSTFLTIPHLQLVHGRPVLVAGLEPSYFDGPQVPMRNWLPSDPETWLASRATIAILHRNPDAKERAAAGPRIREAAIEDLTARWGPPFYIDDRVAAFDLDRIRSQVVR